MSTDSLLTMVEVGDLLRVSPKVAQRLLEEWGVRVIWLGAGRGRGYRVRKEEVLNALLHAEIDWSAEQAKTRARTEVAKRRAVDAALADLRQVLTAAPKNRQ